MRFSLPDLDVFAINANAGTPAQTATFAGVGTVLFNMVTNPVSGKVYVSNTDARNEVRFEGPGDFASTTVRGHLHESRITVLDGANVLPRHLNKHLNYATVPSPAADKAKSLATPVGMAVTLNGQTLYVAAFSSSKVGVFNTAQLETNTFTPNAANQIVVTGGGPSGLVLDEARSRLYVFTRFDNALSVINTATASEIAHLPVYNPEPTSVKTGRPVLYDAQATSSNGEASCASCHIFGDFDSLGWDLGNPDDTVLNNPNPIRLNVGPNRTSTRMKGPMTTQSLRGHGEPRADALARRPHRRQRSRRRRAGRGSGVQEVHRRVRGPAGPQRPDQQRRHAEVHRLHPAGDVSPESDPQPRQQPLHRGLGGPGRLLRSRHRYRLRTAMAVTSSTRRAGSSARTARPRSRTRRR